MKLFPVNLPNGLYQEIKLLAQEEDVTIAHLIRESLKEKIAKQKKKRKPRQVTNVLLEMAKDAVDVGRPVTWARDVDKILYGEE